MIVKFKATAEGEVAIVPRAEYERLKAFEQEAEEDSGTARLIAGAKREIAGGAPVLPKEVVDRLANGENPIRVLRQFRKETQAELAAAVGIAQNYLSDLETGNRKGRSNCIRRSHGFSEFHSTCWRRSQCQARRPIRRDLPNVNKSSLI